MLNHDFTGEPMATSRRLPLKRLLAPALSVIGALLLAACGAGSATPSATAPTASAPAAASAPGSTAAQSGGQAQLDSAVAAGKKEGKIVLSGPPSAVWRTALTSFEKDYPDIKVEYAGTTSRDYWPRIAQEQKAGQFLWDLRVGGPDPQVFEARDQGMLAPVKPLLITPDATDESLWFGGWNA